MLILGFIIAYAAMLLVAAFNALLFTIGLNIVFGYPPMPKFIRTWWARRRIMRHVRAGRVTTFIVPRGDD